MVTARSAFMAGGSKLVKGQLLSHRALADPTHGLSRVQMEGG